MEIEVRARLTNREAVEKKVKAQAKFLGTSEEDDLYLKHAADTERKLILRIRRSNKTALLTFKGKASGSDTAWRDVDAPLSNPDDLEKLLLTSGYVSVVRIIKTRSTYAFGDFEVNLDNIKDLGSFIEVEGRGTEEERENVENKIMELLEELAISSDQIIRKGYVPLMLEKKGKL